MPVAEVDWQLALNPIQSPLSPKPSTLASATVIAPTHRFTRLTGTTVVTTITPPAGLENTYHELVFVWTTGTASGFTSGVTSGGGIAVTTTTVTDRPIILFYDPRTKLYYTMTVA